MRRRDRCERVRDRLPELVAGDLGRLARRRVERHLAGCESCRYEAERQRIVADGLEDVGRATTDELSAAGPPDDLLATLLEQAHDGGLRTRAAVPARGAVSGARPGLSVALAIFVLATAGLAAWAGWQLGHRVARSRRT